MACYLLTDSVNETQHQWSLWSIGGNKVQDRHPRTFLTGREISVINVSGIQGDIRVIGGQTQFVWPMRRDYVR